MADISNAIAGNKFDEFKCNANDVIEFKLVRNVEDINNHTIGFQPDMTHQIFGESESIFGYRNLKIKLYCAASSMRPCLSLEYTEKLHNPKENIFADDILKTFAEILQHNFATNIDEFSKLIKKEMFFKPYGEHLDTYKVHKNNCDSTFEIYKTKIDFPGFRDYHERLQPFLLFYVDAASFIDSDDDRWDYYTVYEKYEKDGQTMYAFVGYQTVYNYYAYPEKIRPRISQVLILPPYQRLGICAKLIQVFYGQCYAKFQVLDITVEDPSENFQRVRDYVDACNCMKLKSYSSKELQQGFSKEMLKEALEKFKMNKKQARRIYEILRLKAVQIGDKAALRTFRLDVKKRLNLPFQKNGRDLEKLKRTFQTNELASTMNFSLAQRMEYLEKAYEECYLEYAKVVERLDDTR